MITYLPDGREVTVTETPGPVFKAVFTGDPDSVFGYGASADAAVESLLAAEAIEGEEALYRAFIQARARASRAVLGDCADHQAVHHIDGNPYNNTPGNLMLADPRENFRAAHTDVGRLENSPARYLPDLQPEES
jgi:hypothetical protein